MDEDAIYYKDETQLTQILMDLDKKEINSVEWGQYCNNYTAEKVMKEFKEVYLE